MPAIPVLALLGALLVSSLTPVAFVMRGESLALPKREHPAHIVSHVGSSRATRDLVTPFPPAGEQRDSARSLTLRTTLVAHQALATPGAAVPCQPPALATPTPTPTRDDSSLLGPTPTPAPDPDAVVDPLLDTMTAVAAATLEACWNAADWDAVAGLVTPRFLQTALGIDTPEIAEQAKALATLDLGPLRIETIGPVGIWSDGRGAVDVLFFRGRGNPVQAVAARWFLTAERGVVRFDEELLLLPPPLGDRVTIGFAIADDQQPLQWNDPDGGLVPLSPVTALHGANRGWKPHTFLLEGTGGEILGTLSLPPWRQGDLVLLDLPGGTYRLHDPEVAGSELVVRVAG